MENHAKKLHPVVRTIGRDGSKRGTTMSRSEFGGASDGAIASAQAATPIPHATSNTQLSFVGTDDLLVEGPLLAPEMRAHQSAYAGGTPHATRARSSSVTRVGSVG